MFAIIRNVDSGSRRCSVEVSNSSGIHIVPDVLISEPMPGSNCTPKNGQHVEIRSSDSGWYIERYFGSETDRANREREAMDLGPGDNVFGGAGAGSVGVLEGGIAVCLADDETGIIASKSSGTVNVLGRTIAFLNSLYQKTIVAGISKLHIEETLSGPLPTSARRKKILDTAEMEESTEYNGFKKISIKIDGNPLSPIPIIGTTVEAELTALNGIKTKFKVDGLTGNLEIESGLATSVYKAVTGEILFGSNGDPMDGIVTYRTPCQATGLGHCGASTKIKAGI